MVCANPSLDKAKSYYRSNPDSCLYFLQKSLETALTASDTLSLAKTYRIWGSMYFKLGQPDSSIKYWKYDLALRDILEDSTELGKTFKNIGFAYRIKNFNQLSLEHLLKAKEIAHHMHDTLTLAKLYNSLGLIYIHLDDDSAAIECINTSYDLYVAVGDSLKLGFTHQNLGMVFFESQKFEEALKHFLLARKYYLKNELHRDELIINLNLAAVYREMGHINKAQTYLKLAKSNTIGQGNEISRGVKFEEFLLLKSIGANNKALQLGLKVLDEYLLVDDINRVSETAKHLQDLYKRQNDYKSAIRYAELHELYEDSLMMLNKDNLLAEAQAKLENHEKENEIRLLQQQNAIKDLEVKRGNWVRNSLVGLTGFILIVGLLVYNRYRIKSKSSRLLQEQNFIIEAKNRDITDSINYARRIQSAFLPDPHEIDEFLPQSFVYFQPKDIVSGDFYWILKKDDWVYFAVADCTGHGVPGAFMSLIGSTYFTEVVERNNNVSPNEVLNQVRSKVINALHRGDEGVQDGMDAALCRIHLASGRVEFAGAHNNLFLVRKMGQSAPEGRQAILKSKESCLYEFKGNRFPVGPYVKDDPFSLHSLQLLPGDMLYLQSDGFADQFGGNTGKKFKIRNLKKLYLELAHLPIDQQNKALKTHMHEWMVNYEQNDDMCIWGLKWG